MKKRFKASTVRYNSCEIGTTYEGVVHIDDDFIVVTHDEYSTRKAAKAAAEKWLADLVEYVKAGGE